MITLFECKVIQPSMTKLDISASAFVCKQPENQGGKPGPSLVPQNTGEGQMWHLS